MDEEVPAAAFKARCLELMDRVSEGRTSIVITKRGRPVARLVSVAPPPPLFGALRGSVVILDDLVAPTGERWEADE
jgi:prevent-host-death family protein